jgi:23S rRNA pseudouridine955/2504/2580 synthase
VTTLTIGRDDAGQRLDRFVRKLLPSATLGHVFKLIRKGRVRVNGRKGKPDARLQEGDEVELRVPEESVRDLSTRRRGRRSAPAARSLDALRILHRDEHVLAVDKPPMLLVQPGDDPAEPSLDQLVLDLVGEGDALTFRPSLAHRIDRNTSGVVLFGLSAPGLRGLTEAFRERRVVKRYLALVYGAPDDDRFVVDLPLARDASDESRGKRVKVSRGAGSQSAVTDVVVRARGADGGLTLVEARPRTGRTHQIRAHLRAVGLPIVGDPTYGHPRRNEELRRTPGLWRQFLHAWRLELDHPVDGGPLRIESPLPDDLARTLRWADLALDEEPL